MVPNEEIIQYVLQLIKNRKPETTEELLKLIQQKYPLPQNEVIKLLLLLENENKLKFRNRPQKRKTLSQYLFSFSSLWYWLVIVISITTVGCVFLIPENNYPLTYLRQLLGFVFVVFLPGFVFQKALCPSAVPLKTSSERLDMIERIALSLGLSIALVTITGLILNYTPWGIRLTPVVFALLLFSLIFSTVALMRDYLKQAA
jgi:uncharacterized membrane protein